MTQPDDDEALEYHSNAELEPEATPGGPAETGLFCFLNIDRPCSAECMAYVTTESESPALSDQQKRCTLLVAAERLGRYAGGGVSLLRKHMEDAKRAGASPPSPGGKS